MAAAVRDVTITVIYRCDQGAPLIGGIMTRKIQEVHQRVGLEVPVLSMVHVLCPKGWQGPHRFRILVGKGSDLQSGFVVPMDRSILAEDLVAKCIHDDKVCELPVNMKAVCSKLSQLKEHEIYCLEIEWKKGALVGQVNKLPITQKHETQRLQIKTNNELYSSFYFSTQPDERQRLASLSAEELEEQITDCGTRFTSLEKELKLAHPEQVETIKLRLNEIVRTQTELLAERENRMAYSLLES